MLKLNAILPVVFFLTFMSSFAQLDAKTDKSNFSYDELCYTPHFSIFTLWSPTAEGVRVNLYVDGLQGSAFKVLNLKQKGSFWSLKVKGNLSGKFYTFQIKHLGSWLNETPGIKCKATGANGRRAGILNLKKTDPVGWDNDVRPVLNNFTDIVLYEMHLRDFSVSPSSGMKNKGKYLALTENQTSAEGLTTGIDHLKDLGVTHVHILPAFDFGCIDETNLSIKKYNWGYDPQNYNVPEGSYSTNPFNPETRIREFKEMVQSFHNKGLRVIMDVVYNHTYRLAGSNFELTAPGYFYRFNSDGTPSNASGCGNETASEKAMMRQYIIESVCYWVNEYHIDGFRFDLMGVHDIQTMNEVRKALDAIDPSLFIYGEGWTAGNSPLPEAERAIKQNGLQMPRIAVFSDDFRDAVKGSWNNHQAPGFASGLKGMEESVKFGIVGAIQHPQVDYTKVNYSKGPYANNPDEVINYVSCHDDLCLFDKLKVSAPAGSTLEDLIRMDKLAQTMVFTAQGVPFMLSGEELLRTKFGVSNSFESPDSINQLHWENKLLQADVFNYYKELIRLRKEHPAFRMNLASDVQQHLSFLENSKPDVVGFVLKNYANNDSWKTILVIHNGNNAPIEMDIPDGTWTMVVADGKIDMDGIKTFSGNRVTVPAISSMVAYIN
ncbi:MAG TPA: type I pullulanase [Bacteroidales bacterium]|nr:type I pullulanase [Bacteroidales bacterium]